MKTVTKVGLIIAGIIMGMIALGNFAKNNSCDEYLDCE